MLMGTSPNHIDSGGGNVEGSAVIRESWLLSVLARCGRLDVSLRDVGQFWGDIRMGH